MIIEVLAQQATFSYHSRVYRIYAKRCLTNNKFTYNLEIQKSTNSLANALWKKYGLENASPRFLQIYATKLREFKNYQCTCYRIDGKK